MQSQDLKDPRDRAAAVRMEARNSVRMEARNSVRTYSDSHYAWDWPRNAVRYVPPAYEGEDTVTQYEKLQEQQGL